MDFFWGGDLSRNWFTIHLKIDAQHTGLQTGEIGRRIKI